MTSYQIPGTTWYHPGMIAVSLFVATSELVLNDIYLNYTYWD